MSATKRPKLTVGHSYRFTFTSIGASSPSYSKVIEVGADASTGRTARQLTMWANRWQGQNNEVAVIEVDGGAS